MKAFVTSIGEPTTELCLWSLNRLGLETILIEDHKTSPTTLYEKLEMIFDEVDDDFLRVDADVVVNQNILGLVEQTELWWYQALCFGWFAQDLIHGGIQFIRKQALPAIRQHIKEAENQDRPESYLSRLAEFHNPRVFGTYEKVCGIHGFKQNDTERIKAVKLRRGVYGNYDWELAERLDSL